MESGRHIMLIHYGRMLMKSMKKVFIAFGFTASFLLLGFLLPKQTAEASCSHYWSNWYSTKTRCEQQGYRYRACYLCGQSQIYSLPPQAHSWGPWYQDGPTCLSDGHKYRYCANCSAKETITLPRTGKHTWGKWFVAKKADYNHTGKRKRTCKICSATQSKKIPKKKTTKNQKAVLKQVRKYMNAAIYYNPAKLLSCFAQKPEAEVFSTKEYLRSFYEDHNLDITYSIKKVKVTGKTATVQVRVYAPDVYDTFYESLEAVADGFYRYSDYWTLSGNYSYDDGSVYIPDYEESFSELTMDEVNRYMEPIFIDLNKLYGTGMRRRNVTIPYVKTAQGWKIQTPNRNICDIATCMYQKAYYEYRSDWPF